MKTTTRWLIASVFLNAVLLALLPRAARLGRNLAPDESARPVAAIRSTPAPSVPVARTAPAPAVPPAPTPVPRPFHWSQVESTNYFTFVANLRAIGCPEQTIRDIVEADLKAVLLAAVSAVQGSTNQSTEAHAAGPVRGSASTHIKKMVSMIVNDSGRESSATAPRLSATPTADPAHEITGGVSRRIPDLSAVADTGQPRTTDPEPSIGLAEPTPVDRYRDLAALIRKHYGGPALMTLEKEAMARREDLLETALRHGLVRTESAQVPTAP
jgi:hypothetical protein